MRTKLTVRYSLVMQTKPENYEGYYYELSTAEWNVILYPRLGFVYMNEIL